MASPAARPHCGHEPLGEGPGAMRRAGPTSDARFRNRSRAWATRRSSTGCPVRTGPPPRPPLGRPGPIEASWGVPARAAKRTASGSSRRLQRRGEQRLDPASARPVRSRRPFARERRPRTSAGGQLDHDSKSSPNRASSRARAVLVARSGGPQLALERAEGRLDLGLVLRVGDSSRMRSSRSRSSARLPSTMSISPTTSSNRCSRRSSTSSTRSSIVPRAARLYTRTSRGLTHAVQTADALLDQHRVPRQVEVHEHVAVLQILPLAARRRSRPARDAPLGERLERGGAGRGGLSAVEHHVVDTGPLSAPRRRRRAVARKRVNTRTCSPGCAARSSSKRVALARLLHGPRLLGQRCTAARTSGRGGRGRAPAQGTPATAAGLEPALEQQCVGQATDRALVPMRPQERHDAGVEAALGGQRVDG